MARSTLTWAVSVAVIGTLLAGGYLLTRGGGDETVESSAERFARLAARPLELPRNRDSGGECLLRVGAIRLPGVPSEGALGPWPQDPVEGEDRRVLERRALALLRRGPVYSVIGGGIPRVMHLWPSPDSRWAIQEETLWISKRSYIGPVLVRGGRVDGRSRIRFGGGPNPRLVLRLGAGEWDEPGTVRLTGAPLRLREDWRVAMRPTRVKEAGCYALQVDGEGFSYLLPFAATVQGER